MLSLHRKPGRRGGSMHLSLHPRRHFSCLHVTRFLPFNTARITSDATSWRLFISLFEIEDQVDRPLLSAGFRAGSKTISAFAAPKVIASACPVLPPPVTSAQTLYLSILPVAFNAHSALSLSCIRPKALLMLLPFTSTSPCPCTRYTLAELDFRRPTP